MTEHVLEGPYFDDLRVGDVFDQAPAVTLTAGHATAHQMILGDRLRLPLDERLTARVLGADTAMAHPALVWDIAIGQSTEVTQRVVANLFYRGFAFHRTPVLGDTLHTRTEVAALRQNRSKPTGLAALRITTTDQEGRSVLDFWRCAMLPQRDPPADTGHRASLDDIGSPPSVDVMTRLAAGFDLDRFRTSTPNGNEIAAGTTWQVVGGDLVSSAPELARLTMNLATVHHDRFAHPGGRLVYGGHTIGLAMSHITRALPNLVTVAGWHSCDHTGPVREGDTLYSKVTAEEVMPLAAGGSLVHLRVTVQARDSTAEVRDVLDWHPIVLLP